MPNLEKSRAKSWKKGNPELNFSSFASVVSVNLLQKRFLSTKQNRWLREDELPCILGFYFNEGKKSTLHSLIRSLHFYYKSQWTGQGCVQTCRNVIILPIFPKSVTLYSYSRLHGNSENRHVLLIYICKCT